VLCFFDVAFFFYGFAMSKLELFELYAILYFVLLAFTISAIELELIES
jgi:hypothetical protein